MLNLGAKPPQSTITIQRGHSSAVAPITSVSARVYAKRLAYKDATTIDTSTLRLIPWSTVYAKLLKLNPHLLFRPHGDGRIVIGLDKPSPGAIAAYEALPYYDRKEIDAPGTRETPGPRIWAVMASSNAVEPYIEIVSSTPPHGPVARSLVTICKALIREGAFTWAAAERIFGMPLQHVPVTRRVMPTSIIDWNKREDSTISIGGK